jgi:hypothetical protein
MFEKAQFNRKESLTLIELKEMLLSKLISGEVRVPALSEVMGTA